MDARALAVEYLPLAELTPHAKNARTHSPRQVEQIAASLREFGWTNPVLIDEHGGIIAGHGRVLAAHKLGYVEVPAVRVEGLTSDQIRAYVIADNQLALNAGWDREVLQTEVALLKMAGFDLDVLGFSAVALSELVGAGPGQDLDVVPPLATVVVSRVGDLWELGRHRVLCGDSTSRADMARLMGNATAHLLHADPPYGMGKEADGVANDNLYADKLDEFQMAWWAAARPYLASNASAYIWGAAPDLWRLWYVGGLADSERLTLRNEIVWDKKSIAGMASPDLTQYPEASERALFFQFGNQFLGNINLADFPESWEPVRAYLEGEAKAAGIKQADVKRLCNCRMYGHWFTRSQFTLIPERHYAALARAYPGRFTRPWRDVYAEWEQVRGAGRAVINGRHETVRSFFDNAHEVMYDVWDFARVVGEERFEHATPKPVAMMERVLRSSLSPGALCLEPFGGTGSTLIGAETTGRACNTMELQPRYVDVIVRRWQRLTAGVALCEGESFNDREAALLGATEELAPAET